MQIHVLAGDEEQFNMFVLAHHPTPVSTWRYSHKPEHLKGCRGGLFILIGSFDKNALWAEYRQLLARYEMKRIIMGELYK